MDVQELRYKLTAEVADFTQKMAASERHVTSLAKSSVEMGQRIGSVMSTLGVAFGTGALTSKLVSTQREFDVLNSSLKTVAGGSAAVAREMEWIKQFAKDTPFGLSQATQGFVKMKALGLDPSRAALTSYGNTASAMGKDLNQMIEAVADASTGEFERLKEFGIKANKEGDNVKLTFQGVTKTIGNNSAEISKYLEGLGNNQFAVAMAERANTLDGAISSLDDTWSELFRTVSNQGAGTLMHDIVRLAEGAVTDLTTVIAALNTTTAANAGQTGAMATVQEGLAIAFETVVVLGTNVKYTLVQVGNELGGLAAQAVAVATGEFTQAATIWRMMKADAEKARAEVDAQRARILNARQIAALSAPNDYDEPAIKRALATKAAAHTAVATAAKAQKAAEDPLQDTAKAYAQVMGKIADATTDSETAANSYTKTQKTLLDLFASDAFVTMPDAWKAEVIAKAQAQIATEQLTEAEKSLATAKAGAQKIADAANAAQAATTAQLAERLQTLLAENELIGLNTEQRARAVSIREEQIIADKEIELIMARNADASATQIADLEREINLRKQLVSAMRSGAVRQATADLAQQEIQDAQRMADQIGQGLANSLMQGGKSAWEYIKGLFRTQLVMRVGGVISGGITGLLGGGASAANAATSAGTSALGSAASSAAGSALFGGASLSSLGTAFGEGFMATLGGSSLSGGTAAGLLAGGAAPGTGVAGTIGAAAPYAIAAVAALAAIGAFRSTKTVGGGLTGTLGEGDINAYDLKRKSGYLFGGPDYSIADKGVAAQSAALQTAFATSRAAMVSMADTLGLGSDAIKTFTARIGNDLIHPDTGGYGLKLDGLTADQAATKVQEALASANEAMAKTVLSSATLTGWMARLAAAQTTATSTLQVLVDYPNKLLEAAGTSRDALVQTFAQGLMTGDAQAAGQAVADQLVASIETGLMGNASAQIFDIVNRGIVTPMVDALLTGQSVTEAMSKASIDSVVAKATAAANAMGTLFGSAEFQAAMASIRSTVGSSLGTAGAALGYTSQYQVSTAQSAANAAQVAAQATAASAKAAAELAQSQAQAAEDAVQSASAAMDAADQRVKAFFDRFAGSVEDASSTLSGLSTSIRGYIDGLNARTGSPTQDLASTRAAFDRQLALAKSGDRDAMGSITQYADRLISAGEQRLGAMQGAQLIAMVKTQLAALPAQVSAEQLIVDSIDRQTLGLANNLTGNFARLDTNVDGLLTFDELRSAGLATDGVLGNVIAALDANGDGMVSAMEAMTGTLASRFDAIDLDISGAINFAEFSSAFAGLGTESTLKSIFATLDTDGDGQISRLEAIRTTSATTAENTYGLDKLTRISEVINSLQWGRDDWNASSVSALSTIANQQGWTADDMSKALGRFSGPEIADFFAKYGKTLAVGGLGGAATSTGSAATIGGVPKTSATGGFTTGGGGSVAATASDAAKYYGALGTPIFDAAAVDRLDSIDAYVNTLDWGAASAAASAWQTYQDAQTYGVTQQELAVSTGYNLSDIQAMFDAAGVPRFASGAAFRNGVVSRPTMFGIGQMGEAGAEAIMPLANIGGSLGIRYAGPDFSGFGRAMDAMAAEIRSLRQDNERLHGLFLDVKNNTRDATRELGRIRSEGLPVHGPEAGDPVPPVKVLVVTS